VDFFPLTPHATGRTIAARSARVNDDIVMGAYQGEAFARTKRMKNLKAYQTKRLMKKDGNEQGRMLAALGITPDEIEEARKERDRLVASGALQSVVKG